VLYGQGNVPLLLVQPGSSCLVLVPGSVAGDRAGTADRPTAVTDRPEQDVNVQQRPGLGHPQRLEVNALATPQPA
jgi:hypothetical protein